MDAKVTWVSPRSKCKKRKQDVIKHVMHGLVFVGLYAETYHDRDEILHALAPLYHSYINLPSDSV